MTTPSTPGRIGSTLATMLQTRLDLVRVELEEEFNRFSSWLVYGLVALFCAGIAVCFFLWILLALFWESRVTVIVIYIAVFGIVSAILFLRLRKQILTKPRLLEHSMNEFKKDLEVLCHREPVVNSEDNRGLS